MRNSRPAKSERPERVRSSRHGARRCLKFLGSSGLPCSAAARDHQAGTVDVRLQNGPIDVLKKAAEELKTKLTGFAGTSAIEDDLPYGKQELVFALTPRGTALGFTGASVGRQVRNAFEGAIATPLCPR